ncbi:adenylosuccinate synthetase [Nocardioides zeae]|uniref:Adenylosuccinate synthetase n=1 Tax=Nocardioides imazamoxiresistens TaxID=3231893 RepID=A0ABU3PUV0_9ACTN|nr:adenylosuccinate synthetase [Nocardioides zeae]MDT9593005.1 adenylosuccinate synthetase [Nocardioides zeae]
MEQPHRIVVGLGFGDEAKGATVDHLCVAGGVSAVVRFSGGGQAAHNVVAGGVHHTFRQFGSGTLAGVASYLSRHVLVSPDGLAAEAEELAALGVADPLGLVAVSPDALVVTPVHRAANRTREDLRGDARHGSCGLGIGETQWYALPVAEGGAGAGSAAIRVRDCLDPMVLRTKLVALVEFYEPLLAQGRHEAPSVREMALDLLEFAQAVAIVPDSAYLTAAAARGSLVFEGSQGVLLDEWRGFHPHTTWSTVTPAPAQELLAAAGLTRCEVWGATRAYATRHGAGPFPSEAAALLGSLPEPHNGTGEYQGDWRVGHLDLVLLRYAAEVCRRHGGLDRLAVSHLDLAPAGVVDSYGPVAPGPFRDLAHQEGLTRMLASVVPVVEEYADDPADLIARELGVPLGSVAHGPAREDRRIVALV